jgi:hypothetical protein
MVALTRNGDRNRPGTLHQFEVLDALEMNFVPCEQRQAAGQSNTGNQTVTHSDLLTRTVKLAANVGRVPGGSTATWCQSK